MEVQKMQEVRKNENGEFIEVDLAKSFKELTVSNAPVKFCSEEVRQKILSAQDSQLLIVTSTISSPKKIMSVQYYDKEYLNETI